MLNQRAVKAQSVLVDALHSLRAALAYKHYAFLCAQSAHLLIDTASSPIGTSPGRACSARARQANTTDTRYTMVAGAPSILDNVFDWHSAFPRARIDRPRPASVFGPVH
jgi:hypothetical protein